jgi:hypothetical protein
MQDWPAFWNHVRTRRHGVVVRGDGVPFGIADPVLRRTADQHALPLLHPGVWLAPGADRSAFLTRLSAARAWIGEPAHACRLTALHLHGIVDHDPPRLEFWLPRNRRDKSGRGVVARRCSTLVAEDLTMVSGFSATTVPRSIADLGRSTDVGTLENLMIDARFRRRVGPEVVADLTLRLGWLPGRRMVRRAAAEVARSGVDSPAELDFRRGLERGGIKVYPHPFPFRCSDGRLVHWDVPVPWAWLALEVDGLAHHGSPHAFHADRRKWAAGRRDGWDVRPFSVRQIRDDLSGVVEEVRAALALADPTRPAPRPARPIADGPGLVPPPR